MSVLKIAITGPESSGKSTLTKELASVFQTSFAPEYAREYLEKTDGKYGFDDLIEIAKGQLLNEKKALKAASKICFFDTDMLVLKIWAQFRYGKIPKFIDTAFRESKIDGYLLCSPDIPWEPDPFRESPNEAERKLLFEIYENELIAAGKPYAIIHGLGPERLLLAEAFIASIEANN